MTPADVQSMIAAINRPMAINRDPEDARGLWYVAFLEHSPRSGGHGRDWSAYGPTFERAFCLAAAKLPEYNHLLAARP
jgi:hypothetical protein